MFRYVRVKQDFVVGCSVERRGDFQHKETFSAHDNDVHHRHVRARVRPQAVNLRLQKFRVCIGLIINLTRMVCLPGHVALRQVQAGCVCAHMPSRRRGGAAFTLEC
jgi:hypothetical protein